MTDFRSPSELIDAQAWGRRRTGPKRAVKQKIYERDGLTCAECRVVGRPAPEWTVDDARNGVAKLTIDHVVPLSRGGTNRQENLRVLCQRCNGGKSNKL